MTQPISFLVAFFLAGVLTLTAALSAGAQDAAPAATPAPAIAYAYAPEAAFEACRGTDALEAGACARAACAKAAGVPARDCLILAACDAAGWSGAMSVQMMEAHFSTAICGAPSRAALLGEFRARCAGHAEYGIHACQVWRIDAPDGTRETPEIGWTGADFAR